MSMSMWLVLPLNDILTQWLIHCLISPVIICHRFVWFILKSSRVYWWQFLCHKNVIYYKLYRTFLGGDEWPIITRLCSSHSVWFLRLRNYHCCQWPKGLLYCLCCVERRFNKRFYSGMTRTACMLWYLKACDCWCNHVFFS